MLFWIKIKTLNLLFATTIPTTSGTLHSSAIHPPQAGSIETHHQQHHHHHQCHQHNHHLHPLSPRPAEGVLKIIVLLYILISCRLEQIVKRSSFQTTKVQPKYKLIKILFQHTHLIINENLKQTLHCQHRRSIRITSSASSTSMPPSLPSSSHR